MTKRELLEKIKRGELSPAEGMAQLQALARRKDRETPQAASAEGAIAGQAVRLHRPGTLAELALEAIEVGPPGPGQIRVRTRAFSLNFGDLLSLRGLYPTMPPYPFTPGFELAGIVDALGPGVAGPGALEVGDAVIAMLGEAMGAHASVVLVDAGSVVPKPASVSFAEACAAPVAFLTATHVLARAGLEAGESILIQSAAGGVGLFLVQLARAAGATIFGTASTPAKLEHLRSLGVQHPINYVEHDFHERVQALTAGRGVDVVVNTLTGEAIQKGLDLLAPGGRYVEIAMSGLKAAPKLDLSGLCDNQSFISVDLRRLMLRDQALTARYVARMVEALEARTALPTIGRVLPLESIREAYALLEDRSNVGKVVVEVPEAPARVQPERVQVTTTPKAAAPRSDAGALEPIAVVGMAGRFPSSENLDAFWSNLAEGRDCVAEIPAERWSVERWFDADPTRGDTTYCRWGGVLDEVDRFDPAFFHMSRREAELCEPQQRVFLETAWHALDHAGYAAPVGTGRGTGRAGSCGVYVGASTGDYVDVLEAAGSHRAPQAMIGNESSVIAGRIAYTLDLDGPAVAVNTACSASLVAIHMACEALRAGACEMALAGGVFVSLTPAFFVLASNARMLSPTGRCRSFARDADGFVPGEGVGAVVLKPLSAARRDGDRVYGLIRASAMNQDGRTNALTAPSPRAQAKLMRSVYARAGVSPRTIDAIEAHGTGTKLGDPVEVDALTEVFREATSDSSFCALGSVKSSIGHAVTAAGVASVLKMLLGLQRGAIPPTLHAEADNEFIDFPSTPFFVNRELTPWVRGQSRGESPRRAGVSSFGFSGTNAHLLLEESPADLDEARGSASRGPWLFPISGFDAAARGRVAERLGAWLRDGQADSLGDLAFTLQRRRAHLGVRAAVVASTRDELLEALDALAEGRLHAALICGPERGEGELGAPKGLLELAQRELEARLSAAGGELDLASVRAVGELYVSGREPAWEQLPTGRVLSLPPYPFARVRCWPSAAARGRAVELEPAPDYGLLAGGPAFRVRVSGDDPMLAEHRVAGRAILPGVASVELALAALDRVAPGQARGGAGVRLEQLMWLRPLVAEGPGGLEAYVTTRAIEGGVELRVETQTETGERLLHTQVFARWGTESVAASTPVASFDSSVEVEDFYGRLGRAHIDYGPWYRCVRGIAATPEGLVAELALAPERRGELERYRLHPGLADAAMQAVAGLILGVGAEAHSAGSSRPAVAVSVDRVLVLRSPKARCFAHVHAHAGEALCFTVTVADERGQTCARFEGLRLATLESDAPRLVHAPSWEPVLESQALVVDESVVLLAGGLAPGLPAGVSVRAVANPTRAGFAAALSGSKPARVVACFGADAQPWSLVALAAALESLELDALELSVVTCGAERLPGLEPDRSGRSFPGAAAGLSGLATVIAREHPRWRVRCLDVEAGSSAMDWRAPVERRSTALALREGGLWRRALVPVDAGALEASAFVEGGTYLIVGGAGTIGFDLSMRLARRCGATVVWMGRRPLKGQVAERAAAVAEAGGEVLYVQADVGDPEAVEAAVAELLGACEGLDGVVFAALAFAQAELAELDAASFAAAHDYKVAGVRHLVDALRGVALDFFLIVSSIQSMVGDRGQGAYAAASAYQDALADAGVDAPWPLKVVDCGYWGSGPTAEAGNRERLAAIGHGLIDPEQGLDAIEGVLASDLARVVLIDAAPDVLAELGAIEAPALVPGGRAAPSSLELATHEQPLRALTQGVSFDVDASARAVWEGRLDAGLLALFAGLGLNLNAGALEDWRTQAGVQPRYRRLFDSLVGLLRERGLLEETATGSRLVAKGSGVSAPLPASLEPHQRLLDTCVAAAPGILRGETLATDVLFPGGSTELVEGIYKDNPVADGFNQVCAGTVARAVEARLSAGAEVVRVLELGAGTGGTSAGVLAALGRFGAAVEYTYTDVSEAFLDHGRARFAGAGTQLRFALLDASAEPTGQGFEAKAYDLVLAANVLHATARIRETLGHARALLRRGGWLVLNEVTRVEAFTTLTFGLLDGWWAFDDEALRLPGGPLLDVPGWRRVLAAEGFVRSVALGEGGQHVLVAEADGRRQLPRVQEKPRPSAPRPVAALAGAVEQPPVSGPSTSSAGAVAECLAKALSMDPGEIDGERAFAEYGLDSLTGIDLVTALNRRLGLNLRTTVLYDYGSYDALVAHIDGLPEFVAAAPAPAPAPVATPVAPAPIPARARVVSTPSPAPSSRGAVAIIGMSGRYPGAVDLDAYWSMLEAGRCAVREVPSERWSLDGFHDPQRGVKRRSYCKVGGFIDAIDEFDPSFFRFSRAEAEQTAPQQRLFLEQAWRTIEDAGYSAQRLAESDCGVIAGGLDGDYLSRLVAAGAEQPQALWGTDSSVIAARVAYFLNLRGPTVVLNTACSSALTAIHLACDRIRSGQNSLMLAGASFLLDRAFYVFAAQAGMLSPAGVCRAFDDRADGFVPGEGVGLVLLKSLDEALRDGDRIHGVIRASGINQDGRTNGITAPSTVSQTQLEAQVYRDFDVDPASISYIETHGTGTSLGDPIEYQALTQAWAQASAERGSAPAPVGGCAIASVKTNIGHAAVASGMASVHKVLLAMRHQSIPASLHFEQPNRHIAFAGSPFVVNTETKAWACATKGPRRAAISGFGMSGTNAHLVLEEAPARIEREAPVRSAYLFPVSARTEEALRTYLSELAKHCAQTRDSAARIAWTLQVGRSEFPVRVAFVAADLDELRRAIEAFVAGQGSRVPTRNLRRDPGQPRLSKAELAQRSAELGTERDVTRLREGLATLAEAFVHGQRPDWAALLGAPAPTPVPLPGHPLRKIRCWIPEGTQATAEPVAAQAPAPAVIQVQRGRVDGRPAALLELDPQAWVLDDHRVEGRAIFPGAAYIEFARAAAELLEGRRVAGVHDLVWLRPLSPEGPGTRVVLSWRGDAEAGHFEVRSCGPKDALDGASLPVHARGRVSWGEPEASLAEAPRLTGDERELPAGPELYRAFASMGLGYGPSFQVITELRASSTCAHARLRPNGSAREDGSLQLSPGLLDGALQSLIGLALAEGAGSRDAAAESASPFVPFMVESVAIHGPMRDACRVQVWREPGGRRGVERFSVRVEGDEDGALRVAIRGLSVRRLTPPQPERKPNANTGELLWATPDWRPTPAQPGAPLNPGAVALIGGDEAHRDALARRLGRPVIASSLAEARAQLDASPLAAVVHVPGARPLDEAFTLARLLAAPTSAGPRFGRRARLRLLALHGELDARPLGAFLRSLQAELVGLDVASLGVEAGLSAAEWAEQVAAELGTDMGGSAEVERRVQAGQRSVRRMLRRQPTAPPTPRERAVVLITGGAGGLGAAFARALAKGCAARVVLCGRRPADAAIEALLRELEALGGEAVYAPCDVTNAGAVAALVEQARRRFGAIHGVIHAAGVTRDAKVVDQDPASLATVLGPKLDGARALDEALGASPLDWMVLCGSMSGVWGNPGQAVYAYANAWLDAFAAEREALRAAGRRHGLTCSIAWPLWQRSGGEGMGVDAETQRLLATTMGLEPMPEARGAAALLEALSLGEPAVALAHGRVERLIAALGVEDEASGAGELEAAEAYVRRAAAEALGLALADVDLDESLRDLGADALSSTALARALEARFGGSRSPTSLAAYPSLRSLARSLVTGTDAPTFEVAPSRASSPVEPAPSNTEGAADRLGQRLRELVAELVGLGLEEVELHDDLSEFGFDSLKLTEFANQLNEAFGTAFTPAVMFEFDSLACLAEDMRSQGVRLQEAVEKEPAPETVPAQRAQVEQPELPELPVDEDAVVIVGMSGRLPGSVDLDAFWSALDQGRDLITEVPAARWDWQAASEAASDVGRGRVRWGGFMPEVDRFDPQFFGISPREAELMDPQQRLILECVWHCIEDAGHRPSSLAGTRTALYVGVAGLDYTELVKQAAGAIGAHNSTGMTHSILANRVSYLLNLRGPSSPVDTACSSSLVAIMHAVAAIRTGAADMAIAGGVNALLSPSMFTAFARAGMLSPRGRCRTFDDSADGYVRGEGVGAVFLKPLRRALADGDTIHAIVRGCAQNHGGRAKSLTAPNPNAQADLLVDAWTRAGLHPSMLDYVEAHGTGTSLGDPIELNALGKAIANFPAPTAEQAMAPDCERIGVGSIKTYVGHLEAAAGIAGVLGVLLAMRHGKLPGNLHFETLNRHIRLEGTPLDIVDRPRPWPRSRDAQGRVQPRRAGVSSFGFGGANAHVVLEEYVPAADGRPACAGPQLVVLSARSETALQRQAQALLGHLEGDGQPRLDDLAFTLADGREAFADRLAIVASSLAELQRELDAWLRGDSRSRALQGSVDALRRRLVGGRGGQPGAVDTTSAATLEGVGRRWVAGELHELGELFVGARRVSLPGYAFARERHWISGGPVPTPSVSKPVAPKPAEPAPRPVSAEEDEPFFFRPRWRRVPAPKSVELEARGPLWVVCVEDDPQLVDAVAESLGVDEVSVLSAEVLARPDLRECVAGLPLPEHLVFLGGGPKAREGEEGLELAELATGRALTLLRLIKLLLDLDLGRRALRVSAFSFGVHDGHAELAPLSGQGAAAPADACLHGMLGSLAREYPSWTVELVDLDGGLDGLAAAAALSACLCRGGAPGTWAVRGGAWYARGLETLLPAVDTRATAGLRRGGAYLILGGSGGLGLTLGRHLAGLGARVALVGRRPLDAELRQTLASFEAEAPGARAIYLRADANAPGSIAAAVREAADAFGGLDGVVHSAMDLCDVAYEAMDEGLLRRALTPKVHGCVELVEACAGLGLDWIALFSSGQSLSTDAGQGNYAAACTFEDAYGRAVAAAGSVPVRVINWGYWGSVGAVKDERYRRRLAARGIRAIEPARGLAAFEAVLAAPAPQLLAFAAEPWLRERMGIDDDAALSVLGVAPSRAGALVVEPPALDLAVLERARGSAAALTRQSTALLVGTLSREGALPERGRSFEPEAAAARLGVDGAHRGVWAAFVHLLRDAGALERSSEGTWTVSAEAELLRREAANTEALAARYPELGPHLRLLQACVPASPAILRGTTTAPEVLFPGGSMELVEGIYAGDAITDYHNELAAAAVEAALRERLREDPNARLRVLEIGAGTGGTSASVLARLAKLGWADRLEYAYTDLSAGFVRHGERSFGAHAFARFFELDLERPFPEQGVALGSVDVVLAANVVHATRDVAASVARIKTALRPGGPIVLLETVATQAFATLTFGMTPGWWLFEDPHWRLDHAPLLGPALWRRLLAQEGFGAVAIHGLPGVAEGELVQGVVVGHSDGVVGTRTRAPVVEAPSPAPAPRSVEPSGPVEGVEGEAVLDWLRERFARVLKLDPADFDPRATFEIYGVDSLVGMELVRELETELGPLPATLLFENPTLEALADTLKSSAAEGLAKALPTVEAPRPRAPQPEPSSPSAPRPEPVADTPASTSSDLSDAVVDGLSDDALDSLLARLDRALATPQALRTNARDRR